MKIDLCRLDFHPPAPPPRVRAVSLKWRHSQCVFWLCLFRGHARENEGGRGRKFLFPYVYGQSTLHSMQYYKNLQQILLHFFSFLQNNSIASIGKLHTMHWVKLIERKYLFWSWILGWIKNGPGYYKNTLLKSKKKIGKKMKKVQL